MSQSARQSNAPRLQAFPPRRSPVRRARRCCSECGRHVSVCLFSGGLGHAQALPRIQGSANMRTQHQARVDLGLLGSCPFSRREKAYMYAYTCPPPTPNSQFLLQRVSLPILYRTSGHVENQSWSRNTKSKTRSPLTSTLVHLTIRSHLSIPNHL